MKRILVITALLVFLSSCTQTPATMPTEIATLQPTVTVTPPPTATATPEPTKVSPSMENLPVEWADRIDRIETMTDMDGNERTVAIQKSKDPDKDSKLRALQWDAGTGEWVEYQPQIGWVGWGGWGSGDNEVKSLWDEDIQLPERDTLAEPLRFADGTELPIGYLGNLYNSGDRSENGPRREYFQGYVLKVAETHSGLEATESGEVAIYTGLPLSTGDWMVYVSVVMNWNVRVEGSMVLESLSSLSDFGGYSGLMDRPTVMYADLFSYMLRHGSELVGQPIIQGVGLNPADKNNPPRDELVKSIKSGELPTAFMEPIGFDMSIMPESWWDEVVGK